MTTRCTESDSARAMEDVFAGGGETGARMRTVDWASTPLGPVEEWPQSLRTAVGICLASPIPMLICWGPELAMLYNDACLLHLDAGKHPRSIGQPGRECWPELWQGIGPMLTEVLTEGRAISSDDLLVPLDRNGNVDERYVTFSCSPIREETGQIGGVFTTMAETTERVIGERRWRLLHEQLEREKVEFLSTTAHDLKGPLTTIKGFTQLLRRQMRRHGVLEAGKAEEALQHIERTATRLAQLITELQDITFIRSGQPLKLQLAPTDLTQLVREAVEQFEQTVDSHHIDLTLPPDQMVILGDSSRLQRVLFNLLSNAVKHSSPDTSITVSVTQEGNGHDAAITVVDQGIGIPSGILPHSFDRITQDGNAPGDAPGTDIGLASVRPIVEQHHGTVSVESQEGQCSIFRVTLPLMVPTKVDQT